MLTAARGGAPDQIPFTTYTGVCGDTESRRRLQSKGLGLVNIRRPWTVESPNVEWTSDRLLEGDIEFTLNTVRTPVGSLTQKTRVDSGYGSTWIVEHLVKEPHDYEILGFMLRDQVFRPDYEGFVETDREMGDAGVVFSSVNRVPIQQLWIQYTGLERLCEDLLSHPRVVEGVLQTMQERDRDVWKLVADSPAEFVWCPDNISGEVTGPAWFEKYCAPHYDAIASQMHSNGKRIVAHMDGMMRRLISQVRELNIDIIEAFTPTPDGDLSLAEARRAWEGKVIWINFPSSVHISPEEAIRERTLQILREAAPGDGFLVGVTENVPAFALDLSLKVITDTLAEFGKCPLGGQ